MRCQIIKASKNNNTEYYYGGGVSVCPIGTMGVIVKKGNNSFGDFFDVKFGPNDTIWAFHSSEIKIIDDKKLSSKEEFRNCLKLKEDKDKQIKLEEERKKKEESERIKIIEQFKKYRVGQMVMFNVRDEGYDYYQIGDKGVIEGKSSLNQQLFIRILKTNSRISLSKARNNLGNIELININEMYNFKDRLFMPVQQLKKKILSIDEQLKLLKEDKIFTDIIRDNNFITIKTVDLKMDKFNIGAYILKIAIVDNKMSWIKGRHLNGGWLIINPDLKEKYYLHSPFFTRNPVVEQINKEDRNDFFDICTGTASAIFSKLRDENDLIGVINIIIATLQSTSDHGYNHQKRWKEALVKGELCY